MLDSLKSRWRTYLGKAQELFKLIDDEASAFFHTNVNTESPVGIEPSPPQPNSTRSHCQPRDRVWLDEDAWRYEDKNGRRLLLGNGRTCAAKVSLMKRRGAVSVP